MDVKNVISMNGKEQKIYKAYMCICVVKLNENLLLYVLNLAISPFWKLIQFYEWKWKEC